MNGPAGTLAFAAALALAILGCDEPPPTAPAPPAPAKPAFEVPDDALGKRLALAAQELAPTQILHAAVLRDRLARGGRRDFLTVLVAEHCYRILGVGDDGVGDLDLVLFDPNGVEVRRDLDQAPRATLGVDAELCPFEAGAYRLEARVTDGEGEVLVGVYRTVQ
jgi:hypothetical protein